MNEVPREIREKTHTIGKKIFSSARKSGAKRSAAASGCKTAAVFGMISPKIVTREVIAIVAMPTPLEPTIETASAVARDAAKVLKKLIPTSTSVNKVSISLRSASAVFAQRFLACTSSRSFIFERERYAVSDAAKNPISATSTIKIINMKTVFISFISVVTRDTSDANFINSSIFYRKHGKAPVPVFDTVACVRHVAQSFGDPSAEGFVYVRRKRYVK